MEKGEQKNVIFISVDALRPDHLSCFGYDKIETPYIDEIAKKGAIFENCITVSCLTPVSMASTITGSYPKKHGLRNPFKKIQTPTLAEYFKKNNYKTAGFTGINFLSKRCNFHKGFDLFKEPEEGWYHKEYKSQEGRELTTNWGYWWVPEFMQWIEENSKDKFFVWGHYFECHVHAETWLLEEGRIQEGILSENKYYDAKIKYMDENLFKPLVELLKKKGIFDDTIIVIMSDHGETFDEHPHEEDYPQHRTMFNTDLKSTLIIKGGFEEGTITKKQTRTIDIAPTIAELALGEQMENSDGESIKNIEEDRLAYSEELFEKRGEGAIQAIQDGKLKLIRNNTRNEEEFYNLIEDPGEKNNIIETEKNSETANKFRNILNSSLESENEEEIDESDEEIVKSRLKSLGYIK